MQTAQISHAEGFQIIYVAILLSRKWDVTSTPETWALHADFLPKSMV